MVDLEAGTDRAAIAAARAEGRTAGAELMREFVLGFLDELARGRACALDRELVVCLREALDDQIELFRREQSLAIERYCDAHRSQNINEILRAFEVTP